MNNIDKAIEIFKNGGVVIFPTDTVFGIGCIINNDKAIKRIFQIKQRQETQAVPILVSDIQMAKDYLLDFPEEVENELMRKYWPGGLTIILPCKTEKISPLLRGNGITIGVRIPDNPIIQNIINGLGVPIIGTSANFHGKPSPKTTEDLDKNFIKLVDYVLPGICNVKTPSTIIDCSVKPWKIIRQGEVKISIN